MGRRGFRRGAAGIAAAAVLVGSVAACDCGAAAGDRVAVPGRATLARALDEVIRHGYPGAQVVVTERGRDRTETAGVGDLASGERFRDGDHIRIGSNTKTFVATVLGQIVSEGKVELDAPLERYLPGVVAGNGNDGNRVTVRNLLQHTSGLPDYLMSGAHPNPAQLHPDTEEVRWRRYRPEELVALAMTMPPQFEPGVKAVYTNTNYVLLGMLIERVTGQSVAAQIDRRILAPLGLRETYYPDPGETGLRNPHPTGYHERDGRRIDFTEMDTSWGAAAGAMVSTGADLNRFFIALLGGKLVPATILAEMQHTMPWDRGEGGYGLGLVDIPVSCGKRVWGHGGSIMGFETRTGVTEDGRAVTATVNQLPRDQEDFDVMSKAFDAALCEVAR